MENEKTFMKKLYWAIFAAIILALGFAVAVTLPGLLVMM